MTPRQTNLYNQIKYNGYHISIYCDDDARSPHEAYSNLGTLYTAHRRYRPEKEFDGHFDIGKVFEGHIGNFRESFLKEYIALPVYLYNHGGITISTSPLSCPWDSGFFRIIAVPLDKVCREYGWKNTTAERRKRIEGYLQDEISTLDNYYTGEVFRYRIMPESGDDNELDSCWGFYDTECMKELEAECRHIIDGQNRAVAQNRKIRVMTGNTMKTPYGPEFDTVTETNPEWGDYDKTIAGCHLANARVVIVNTEYGRPIDNEHDLEEIYRILEKKKTGHTKNERHGRKAR